MAITFGSLFAGIGGLDLGLERAGMVCKWQVENNDYAARVLAKHWPKVRRWGDIRTFPPEPASEWAVELVCGGFPCQPVSNAGKRRGESDERWLWDEMCRICQMVKPVWVLAENVPGLLSAASGRLFGTVVRDLASIGYSCEWDCVSAASVGAPHVRNRVFIIGRSEDVADASCQCKHRAGTTGKRGGRQPTNGDWWLLEPDVGRVANGVPKRVDRLKCLGNAVVPQVAERIGRYINDGRALVV